MRLSLLIIASIVIGAALGLGWTVAELGVRPTGSEHVAYGNPVVSVQPLPSKGPPGKAVVDGAEFDFGKMQLGADGRHEFVIRNSGTGTLTLEKGPTTCSCTVEEIDHPDLPPGESTKVLVTWHPKSRGAFRQTATVRSSDPQYGVIDLAVFGDVVASYRVENDHPTFTNILSESTSTTQIAVYSYSTSDLALTTPVLADRGLAPYFEVTVSPMPADVLKDEPGATSGQVIDVKIKPGLPAGPFAQKIRFRLNLPDQPEIEVPIDGSVVSPITVDGPPSVWNAEQGIVMIGAVHSQEGGQAEVSLYIRGDAQQKVKLHVAEVTDDQLQVTLGEMQRISAVTVRVPVKIVIPKGARPVNHLGGSSVGPLARIFIDTGLSDVKQLRILVHYAVEQ